MKRKLSDYEKFLYEGAYAMNMGEWFLEMLNNGMDADEAYDLIEKGK